MKAKKASECDALLGIQYRYELLFTSYLKSNEDSFESMPDGLFDKIKDFLREFLDFELDYLEHTGIDKTSPEFVECKSWIDRTKKAGGFTASDAQRGGVKKRQEQMKEHYQEFEKAIKNWCAEQNSDVHSITKSQLSTLNNERFHLPLKPTQLWNYFTKLKQSLSVTKSANESLAND